jgi:hypothetical protein
VTYGASVVNPVIQGETFTGTWLHKGPIVTDMDDNGLGVLVAVFSTEPDDVTADYKVSAEAESTAQRLVYRKDTRAAAIAVLTSAVVQTAGKTISGMVQDTPEGSIAIVTPETCVAIDTGWQDITTPDGTAKVRAIENDTMANILTAIASVTGGNFLHTPSIRPTRYHQRFSVYLVQAPPTGGASHQNDWANFSEEATGEYKHFLVGSKAWKVKINWGIKQTASHSSAKSFVTGKGNPHISSINGGRHFRATYLTITEQPTLI